MARRGNFLDGDDNFREQNLRFVRNDLEDNINQYFGGGNGERPNIGAPPRDFHVVQPNPGQSEFDKRKEFFLQLGLSRGEAVSLAERSFCLEHFSLNYFRDKRHLLRKSRLRQSEADAKIVSEISDEVSTIERGQASLGRSGRPPNDFGGGRGNVGFGGGGGGNGNGNGGGIGGGFNEFSERRAPSPPRNMDWNERKRGYPGDNDSDGPSVFRNERNFGGLNEFEERRLQFEMNQGRDNFDNFGRRSPQPLQFNDNRNAPNDFEQFGSGRGGVGGRGGGGFNNDDNDQFFTRRHDNEFTQRDDEYNHDSGFGGRPDINDDFNRGANNFNSNALNADFGRGLVGANKANQMIPNNIGGNNMNPNLSNSRADFGPGRGGNGNGNGNSLNAPNVAGAVFRGVNLGNNFNSNSRGDFGIGPGTNNYNASNVGGGNYRDGNGNGNNFNGNSLNLRADYQGSGPSGNMGGDFRGGNNLNKNMHSNLDIGIGPGGDYRGGNNINLNAPNTRGDFGGSGGGGVGRSGGGNNLNAIGNRGGGGANALLPNPTNLRGDFGNNRGATTSNVPNSRAAGRAGGGGGGNNSNLPINSGNNRFVGGGGNTLKSNVPKPLSGPVGGRSVGMSAPPAKRPEPINSRPVGGRNVGMSAPPAKRQEPINSRPVGGRNVGMSAPPAKRQEPLNSGPVGGRNGGMSAPQAKRQEPTNSGPKAVYSNKPKNIDNLVRAKSGPNSNQSNKATQPASKADNSSNKSLAVVRSGGNVANRPNVQDKPVRNTPRETNLNTNNSRNPSQNNGNNINPKSFNLGNNNGNFAGGFWGSGQGPNGNFDNNQGFSGNFSNNQGFGDNFGNNQGFGGNFGNNQGFGGNFGNNQGFGVNFGNNQGFGNGGGSGFGNQMVPGGFCIKSFKVNTNEKYFVNVCQTDKIPPPEDLTEEQLTEILQSETPGNFRIPMSISEPRTTKDKSNNAVDVCDIAINPQFFVKCEKSVLFKDFFLALIIEALSEKYNVQLTIEKSIILNNRKFIGTLVSHRVRNNDVKNVLKSYQNPNEADKRQLQQLEQTSDGSQAPLVQEIDAKEFAMLQKLNQELKVEREKKNASMAAAREPEYKLRAKVREEKVEEIQAELYLPKCISSQEVSLDIGEDRILLESIKHGYIFDKFVNYRLNQERARAIFDKTNKMLQIRIPVLAAK